MKKMMKALALTLAISGIALGGCSVSPADDGNDMTPVETVKASELQKSELQKSIELKLGAAALGFSDATTADLRCGTGRHWSCYLEDCACCPTGKALDCLGPGDCYCCSGTTCM
jgi:hypothetical protein